MRAHATPGVYFEWLDASAHEIGLVRTDVAGFVGFAERGPLHLPVRVESWTQFRSTFGRHIASAYLAYAVEGFFANGGQLCYIVRVADPAEATEARLDVRLEDQRVLTLRAISPGRWGNQLSARLTRGRAGRYTLIVRLPTGEQEQWRDLTVDDADERFVVRVLNGEPEQELREPASEGNHLEANAIPGSLLVRAAVAPSETGLRSGATLTLTQTTQEATFAGGEDGLWTVGPEHMSGRGAPPHRTWGLAALAKIPDVSLVAMPDIMPQLLTPVRRRTRFVSDCRASAPPSASSPREPDPDPDWPPSFSAEQIRLLQRDLVGHCEAMRNRMAILDARFEDTSPESVVAWRQQFDTKYAALYYPWLRVGQPEHLAALTPLRSVPPSGHIAGVFARAEHLVGVHKPPANELVEGATDVTVATDHVTHGFLNDARVNVVRTFAGRGIRVAGARTLSSDSEWRYVNVRRLLLMIERAIDLRTQWLVFEPNRQDVWRDVDRILRTFLDGLWRRGMLDGATADQAYEVACDRSTMSEDDVERGQLIATIGVQPPWPAEFVVARIGRTASGLQMLEGQGETGGASRRS